MASHKLAKVTLTPQPIAGPVDAGKQVNRADAVPDLSGLAGYLAIGSQSAHDRFEFVRTEEMEAAERRVREGVRVMVNVEAEIRLSRWIRSHPNRDQWKEAPTPRKPLFHTPGEREVIRKAYDRFGCDICGTRERPHLSDGLCGRCYNRRQARRRTALMALEVEKG